MEDNPIARRGFWLASLTVLPLLVWWLGWFPGFLSPDSVDQLDQVATGDFINGHPAFHTITMWLITRVWDHAGAVSLVQVVALALVLGLVVRRLVEIGVPLWLGVGTAWLVGLLPAVGPTAITLWKDVAFTVAFLWVFAELLQIVRLRDAYWWDAGRPVRLGAALSLVWLFRHNGLLTSLVVVTVLAVVNRKHIYRLAPTVLTLFAIVLLVQGPLYWVFSVDRSGKPAAAEVLIPVVASSFVHEPENFDESELRLLQSIAPLEVWESRYDCDAADPLLFAPELNIEAIRSDPSPFLRLGVRTFVRDLDTSLGLYWCRASYLFVPSQPDDAYLHRPPFAIAENNQGLTREPVWSPAFDMTRWVFRNAESDGWLWLTWRPALAIWTMIATYAAAARRARVLLIPGTLVAIHLLNVAATSLNHEFRLAFPLYVTAFMSLPLWWFVRYPERLSQAEGSVESPRRTLLDDNVAAVRIGQGDVEGIE
ncbi:MAG: hypothetical protein HKO82_01215 [Acidimicrobiia bacterium]|nr:hypothetical protein [Acidimicrobiia bacterium]